MQKYSSPIKFQDESMETKKQNHKPPKETRSKAQLSRELAQVADRLERKEIELSRCKQELQGLQSKLDEKSDLSARFQNTSEQLENAQQKIKTLESRLKTKNKKGTSSQSQSSVANKQLELALARIKDFENEQAELQARIRSLEQENRKLRDELRQTVPVEPEEPKEPASDTSKLQPSEPDAAALAAPTREQAEPDLDGAIPFAASDVGEAQSAPSTPVQPPSALKAVHFLQNEQVVQIDEPLQPWQPFYLCARLDLDEAPNAEQLDEATPHYSIQVSAKSQDSGEVIATESEGGCMQPDRQVYESTVRLPKCAPGRYAIEIAAIAPAARVGELQRIDCVVQSSNAL